MTVFFVESIITNRQLINVVASVSNLLSLFCSYFSQLPRKMNPFKVSLFSIALLVCMCAATPSKLWHLFFFMIVSHTIGLNICFAKEVQSPKDYRFIIVLTLACFVLDIHCSLCFHLHFQILFEVLFMGLNANFKITMLILKPSKMFLDKLRNFRPKW